MEKDLLTATKDFDIRFSEVDSMQFVWHGSYTSYFEDAREAFGQKYGLGYLTIFNHGFYAPLVDLSFKYKKPMRHAKRMTRNGIAFARGLSIAFQIVSESDGLIKTWRASWTIWTIGFMKNQS